MKSRPIDRETIVHQNCLECQRLWQELSSAAKAYVGIYERIKGVAGKRDGAEFAKMQLRKASEWRRTARRAVKHHESERHCLPPRRAARTRVVA